MQCPKCEGENHNCSLCHGTGEVSVYAYWRFNYETSDHSIDDVGSQRYDDHDVYTGGDPSY